jgi:hypothetical protein
MYHDPCPALLASWYFQPSERSVKHSYLLLAPHGLMDPFSLVPTNQWKLVADMPNPPLQSDQTQFNGFHNLIIREELEILIRHHRAYALACSAALGSILFGWDIGLTGGILTFRSFQSDFGIDKMSVSQLANPNGNSVSVLHSSNLHTWRITHQRPQFWRIRSGHFGRKKCLIVSGIIYLIGSTIQSIAGLGSDQETIQVLYFSHFLGRFGVGMVTSLVPTSRNVHLQ